MSRIYQYPVVTEISNDDYLALGSATNGSRSILASDLAPVIGNKTITERGTYRAADDNMDGYGQVTVDIPYTDIHVASGDIATFEGEDLPLKSLKVAVTPYQDLHGYDAPWAGGAGANKMDGEAVKDIIANIQGATTGTDSDGKYALIPKNAYINDVVIFDGFKANTVYTVMFKIKNTETINSNMRIYYTDNSYEPISVDTIGTAKTGLVVTNSNKSVSKIVLNYNYLTATNLYYDNFGVFEGVKTLQDYSPYSNICPIIGWDEAVVSVSGINVWDEVMEIGIINDTTGKNTEIDARLRTKNYIPIKGGLPFGGVFPFSGDDVKYYFYDANKNFISHSGWQRKGAYNPPNNACFMRFWVSQSYGTTYNNDISINYPSTDTEYHAYNGATYTIDLNGTRYGGTLDVTNGTMTVTHEYVDLGTLTWANPTTNIFNVAITDMNTEVKNKIMCSLYPLETTSFNWASVASYRDQSISTAGNNYIYVKDSRYNSASDFKTAMNGVQLVYELATPITVQLSPTQVKSLVGENNIFADCGAVDVEYQTVWVRPSN